MLFRQKRVRLLVKRLYEDVPLPSYAHPGDAGMDICANDTLTLKSGERALIPTGFAMALPKGYAAFIQPRSGLASKHGITIVNSPGLIDCNYRGEVKVIMLNTGTEPFDITRGDCIAQMVIQRVSAAKVMAVRDLGKSYQKFKQT